MVEFLKFMWCVVVVIGCSAATYTVIVMLLHTGTDETLIGLCITSICALIAPLFQKGYETKE